MSIRVPVDASYAARVGTAVYVFAYYEWAVIYLIQQFTPGFVSRYCRGAPTSGQVRRELETILSDPATLYTKVSIGWLLGGPAGWGTLAFALLIGPSVQWAFNVFKVHPHKPELTPEAVVED